MGAQCTATAAAKAVGRSSCGGGNRPEPAWILGFKPKRTNLHEKYDYPNTEALKFEAFGGAGYVADRFEAPRLIDGALRRSYSHATLLLGEESVHKLGQSTTVRQRLVAYPDLGNRGEYRATWDAGIAVPATQSMNLTAGVNVKYNSDPGSGVKKADTLFTTGISIKFD